MAVAAGTLFSVGWNDIGGKRLWLRDRQGNEFYAHLSAFSPIALEGAQVMRGEVLGYVGTTGDAAGTPAHLHFEIHPVSMLGLGYDGAVNPTSYLESWRRLTERSAAAISPMPRRGPARSCSPSPTSPRRADSRVARCCAPSAPGRLAEQTPYRLQVARTDTELTASEVAALEASLRTKATKFARSSSTLFGQALWDAFRAARPAATGPRIRATATRAASSSRRRPGTGSAAARTRDRRGGEPEEQVAVAEIVLAAQGWNAWPACSRLLGLR